MLRSEPLEPSKTIICSLHLESWTDEGLAFGALAYDADDRLPAGRRLEVLGGIPGEDVEIAVTFPAIWRKKQRHRAHPPLVRLLRVIAPSSSRTRAPCPYFGDCGGCRLQHISYTEQLLWKQQKVRNALTAAGVSTAQLQPAIGMNDPWHFRNQMRFAVNREGQAGLTALETHRVIPMRECLIAHQTINTALQILSGQTLPRPQVLIRAGVNTREILVQPILSSEPGQQDAKESLATQLANQDLLLQTTTFHEQLHGLPFTVRPSSFFQTNTLQADIMAGLVLQHMPAGPDVTVVDAYCGVGTFAAIVGLQAGHVIGIEESASAVKDARENIAALAMPHIEFILGKTEHILPQLQQQIDAAIIDPPRMGCAETVLRAVLDRRIPQLVYISCEPSALARDLSILVAGGYQLMLVQPLDMFPQTYHIETVAVLNIGI